MEKRNRTLDVVYIGMSVALIAICAWIRISVFAVPFTMQTFAVFAVVGLLGFSRGVIAVVVYLLLGAVGVPVFSGFSGGVGTLLGPTGGYIIGFVFSALIAGLFMKFLGKKLWVMIVGMALGLLACYAFGTAWFMVVYSQTKGAITLAKALALCVTPFVIPDAAKIALAILVSKRVGRFVK